MPGAHHHNGTIINMCSLASLVIIRSLLLKLHKICRVNVTETISVDDRILNRSLSTRSAYTLGVKMWVCWLMNRVLA